MPGYGFCRRQPLRLGLGQLVDALLQQLLIGAQIRQFVSLRDGKAAQQRDNGS